MDCQGNQLFKKGDKVCAIGIWSVKFNICMICIVLLSNSLYFCIQQWKKSREG